jgi:hypothetical protein
MKKVLPLLIVVLLAFAGCHRGPAMYERAENPRQLIEHVEKFVNQTEKYSRHYSAEDWQVAVEQFVAMSKNFMENRYLMTTEEQMRFDNARLKFMGAIDKNGNEELVKQVKELYGRVLEQ